MGGGETLRVDVDALGASGKIGLMVRARGVGTVTTLLRGPGGAPVTPPSPFTGPGPTFSDVVWRTNAGQPTHSWSDERTRPVALELVVEPGSEIEIDCVVPFLVP